MVDREVNLLEQRHMQLSARFKSAWAFHQLLVGMQRITANAGFENQSSAFQTLFGRLKQTTEGISGPSSASQELGREITALEQEVEELLATLEGQEQRIAPSTMRQFLSQLRTLDERILIEVLRFYLEIQKGQSRSDDRLDKIDLLLSRLAEKVAGSGMQGDRGRLNKVLRALLTSTNPPEIEKDELKSLSGTLQDLRSEVRWVKTFAELKESRLVDVYRALKHDMGQRIFHPQLLPLVVEVNGTFRHKVEELRNLEEAQILDEYQQLSQLHQENQPAVGETREQLEDLQAKIDHFRRQTRAGNVRLDELEELGETVRSLALQFQGGHTQSPRNREANRTVSAWVSGTRSARTALVPDFEILQPHWSELLAALSGLSAGLTAEEASSESSLSAFRLEPREVEAFRVHSQGGEDVQGVEQFVLAAAALRRRICKEVEEFRALSNRDPGSTPHVVLQQSRETTRAAGAYVKHFSHLIEQSVFDGQAEDARSLQQLQNRLMRDLSGLLILMFRLPVPAARPLSTAVDVEEPARSEAELAIEEVGPVGGRGKKSDLG